MDNHEATIKAIRAKYQDDPTVSADLSVAITATMLMMKTVAIAAASEAFAEKTAEYVAIINTQHAVITALKSL